MSRRIIAVLNWLIPLLYALDRVLRLLAIRRFLRATPPAQPERWPTVTLLSPLTHSPNDLRRALEARIALDYPGVVQHLLICDVGDQAMHHLVRTLLAAHPDWSARLILARPDLGSIASKVQKLHTALPYADGEVLVFVDDDVCLPPDALTRLVRHLEEPGVGAVFGLAQYTAWETPWSSLMSLFVNSWALPSYVPLALLTEPYTITGHLFALRQRTFTAIGGLSGMQQRVDDDHELARRVRTHGLRCVQTPLIYAVENRLAHAQAYHAQLQRWMILPRETMLPALSPRERALSTLVAAGNLLPPLAGVVALIHPRRGTLLALLGCLLCAVASYAHLERRYLGRTAPLRRWPLFLITTLITPLHLVAVSVGKPVIRWRGQLIRVQRDGRIALVERGANHVAGGKRKRGSGDGRGVGGAG